MKKLFILLSILCIVLCTTACNEDKNTSQSWNTPVLSNTETKKRDYNELILGKWYWDMDSDGIDKRYYVVFYSDGTYMEVPRGIDEVQYGRWSIKDDYLTLEIENADVPAATRKISLTESVLTIEIPESENQVFRLFRGD